MAKLKTSQTAQKRFIENYILEAIDGGGYDQDTDTMTPRQKLDFLMQTFKAEYGWLVERKGQFHAMTEWLQGLPSAINIAFMNYDIIELAKGQGSLPLDATDRQEDKILDC